MGGARDHSKQREASIPTTSHKTPQFSQVFKSPANPIDIRAQIYLHKGVDIALKSRIMGTIGSAVANPLNRRLSTNLYNHVADQVHRCL